MTQEYLFIGGPADGQRFPVPSDQTHQYIASHPPLYPSSMYNDEVAFESLRITETLYRKVRLGNPGAPYIFLDDSMDTGSVIKMLIDGYHPIKNQ